ncbi:protoheme IX biogenesis protein HemY [Klebsiella michiganensis]|uniref:protoheme IX biogenesis protein HemY n=1 Tax=Klebsiella michiganensis TaxID=1134687 RepID=UPI00159A7EF3|nr:protoheme IX biogenesis protein HemY [Klebsiella michiganensis]MDG9774441.1 protoheme IX biogenesis protein HemY [Klebsiella michiganensis]MDH0950962.1 protoheme IX biogenesis protein HemY [Klebsiella michiganensis]MDH1035022.1 protoheme IX biogenesis protein HemY [Klebsiella michiganensis]MDH1832795.1 protoheme IX biogenesis protein HemY [Klebsiella michiganensis]MDH1837644.1 protoheme IX biogenesis protein HemY [Klebsiella michiganensis]
MLKILLLFALLLAGIVVGPMIAGHQGYVLIQTDNYNIETSVTGLAIIMILTMVVLFAIEWLLRRIFRTGAHTRGWFVGRKRRRARKQTEQALLKLAEGDYQQVEKLMAKNADHAEQPVVNYLLAAEAAQQRGDEARANQHLERATELAGDDLIPVEITRVRLQLARNENHAARHGIDKLLEITPRHPEVLRLAEQAYIRTGAWNSLLDIIPSMAKANVSDEEHRTELEQLAWIGLMDKTLADGGSEGLRDWWKSQNRKTRSQVALQVAMANRLIESDDHDTAQQIIIEGLKKHYDDRLVMPIPRLKTNNPEQLEKVLRQQIKTVGDRPLLWSTLGQSLMRHGEWQEASIAFRAALKQRPDAFDYAWLADTLDRLHQPEEAATMRRDGLLLTLQNNPQQ